MRLLAIILALALAGCLTVEVHVDCDTITPPALGAPRQSWGE